MKLLSSTRLFFRATCLAASLSCALAWACGDEDELLRREPADVDVVNSTVTLGEWRLPSSPSHPFDFTDARVRVSLVFDDATLLWNARFAFSFPSPDLGIPYAIHRITLTGWADEEAFTADLDYSDSCNGPGRSLGLGRAWTQDIQIKLRHFPARFEGLRLHVEGQRS